MSGSELSSQIEAVRRFTRFYTRRIGVLHEGLLGSDLSLPETRLVYELAHHDAPTVGLLASELALDAGYLSRLATTLEKRGLLAKQPSPADGRQILLSLSERGRAVFCALDARSASEVGEILTQIAPADRARLVEAFETARSLLGTLPAGNSGYVLRPHRPGDMGWIVHRQAVLYSEAYGWDGSFEALVASIVADFLGTFDAARECCWVAEIDQKVVGSVFVVRQDDDVAKLRLLYVEPYARGRGIGERLVGECLHFARAAGYRRMTLWTNDILVAARRIYEKAGFSLVRTEPHHSFGQDLLGEFWERDL